MKSDLTLILLLKGRENFTSRFLKYYFKNNINYKLFIADGSNKKISSKIFNLIKKNPLITYKKFKKDKNFKTYYQKKLASLKIVKTKYIIMVSNDDFIIYSTLKKCMKILKKNNNLNGAGGSLFSFKLEKNKHNTYFINNISLLYPSQSYMQNQTSNRVKFFLNNFRYTDNYILNRKNLIKSYEISSANFGNNISLKDCITDLCNIINGKIKIINSPILFHQATEESDGSSRTNLFLENIKNKQFFRDFIKLIEIISNKTKIDKMYLFEKIYNNEMLPVFKNFIIKKEASLNEIVQMMNNKIKRRLGFKKIKKKKSNKYSNEVNKIKISINEFLKNLN
tara:strand:- start:12 stop:1025 length:1014 start_codon:yes stop_codon:yes gene_type:complete